MRISSPGKLSDEEWSERIQELHFIRKAEADAVKS